MLHKHATCNHEPVRRSKSMPKRLSISFINAKNKNFDKKNYPLIASLNGYLNIVIFYFEFFARNSSSISSVLIEGTMMLRREQLRISGLYNLVIKSMQDIYRDVQLRF
jgi:hypothetical protein